MAAFLSAESNGDKILMLILTVCFVKPIEKDPTAPRQCNGVFSLFIFFHQLHPFACFSQGALDFSINARARAEVLFGAFDCFVNIHDFFALGIFTSYLLHK